MKSRLLISALVMIGTQTASAVGVRYEGQRPVEWRQIESLTNRPNFGADSLKDALVSLGYLDAEVVDTALNFVVRAGNQYRLHKIIVAGDSTITRPLNVPFSKSAFETAVEEIIMSLLEEGYLYPDLIVTQIEKEGHKVIVVCQQRSGPRVTLERKRLSGLNQTDERVASRYLPLQQGDFISFRNLNRAEKSAGAVPFLIFVPPINVLMRPGFTSADLEFNFVERKPVYFEGGAGYVPGENAQWVWNFQLKFQNLFGSGKQVRVLSEKRERDRQRLEVGYWQPVFFPGTGGLGFEAATRDYRDQFYEFAIRGELTSKLSENFETAFGAGFRSIEPSNEAPSFRIYSGSFGLIRAGFDSPLNPSRGWGFDWRLTYSYRRYRTEDTTTVKNQTAFNETRIDLSLYGSAPLYDRLVGYVSAGYLGLETGEPLPPLSELHNIGGPGGLRGYRNEQFQAMRTALVTFEPRWRFRPGYFYLFTDGAYLNNRVEASGGKIATEESFEYGYGLGMSLVNVRRSVNISLGWNRKISFDEARLALEFSSEI